MTDEVREKSNFVRHLKQIIQINNWKPWDFKNRTGFDRATIYRWINGYNEPNYDNMKEVCDKLNVNFEEMISDQKDAPYPVSFSNDEKKYFTMLAWLPIDQRSAIENMIEKTADLVNENRKIKSDAERDHDYRIKNEREKRKNKDLERARLSGKKVADHPDSNGEQPAQYNSPKSSDLD